MPTLSTPTLTLGPIDNNKRNATVVGSITFDAADVGRTFRFAIALHGHDLPGDNLPAGDPAGNELLYTFMWAGTPLFSPFKGMVCSAAGTLPYSETRSISAGTFDEDSGVVTTIIQNVPIQMPRRDEVYARVSLTTPPVTGTSPTVIASFGV